MVKASAQITISKVIDIYACYRYYKLQSSTLAKPNKPTKNPPDGWSDTEPSYVSGSTNTLYFVDCNVYSDMTFSFSEVSKSSSYEAAKDAWNKANNAQNTANDANGKIDGLQVGGRNMLLGSSFDNLPQVDNTYTKYSNNSVKLVVDNTDGTTTKYVSISSLKQSWILSDVIGKTITISMWIYIEKVGQLSGYEFRVIYTNKGATKLFEPDTRYPYYIPNASSLLSGWNYVYGSFTIPDDSTIADFNFTCYATAGKSGYAWFSSPKAEIGNKPTDWTPSPSDAIKDVDVEYYLSTSATSLSGGSWSTTAPTWVNGKYMWSRTVTVDGAGNKTYSPSQNGVCIAGAKGSTGVAGKGVTSIVEQYYKSTSATSLTGGSWSTTYPGWENGKYIWTRSVITYTDKTTTTTTAVCVTGTKGDTGAKGDKGDTGATGNGISKIDEHYAVSSSNLIAPTTWSSTVPTMTTTNKYLWNYETVTYTNGSTVDTTKRVIGVYGNTGSKGDTGATGKGISKVTEHYAVSTSNSTAPTSWSETVPTLTATNKYLWNYETITYTDNTTSDTAKRVIGVYGDKGQTGATGATGAMGETLSNGKLLYKDVMFAEGNNGISSYNNSSGGAVTLVRQAKSSDNPCGDYELVITNTGAASPGIGGFKWEHATRANAVFIYRIIAKIPTDRALRWTSNDAGDVTSGKFLTSNSGTGKFTEYIYKFTCGASGTFSTTGYFYINGSAGSSSSPVKWYVAYAGVWDMTDYEDMLPKDEAKDIYTTQLEMSKTNSELRLDFTKSIASASDDMQSKLDAANNATNQKFGEISKYIRFVDGKIVLGETGSELTLTVQNDRVSFQQAGNEVAYFSNNNLYIRRAEVLTTLKVGNYEFAPRNDGGLALRKRGN